MPLVSLSEALTREHRDIDTAIEAFVVDLDRGLVHPAPLLTAFEALRRHIYLEEVFLFPPIRRAGALMPVLVMVREHGTLWQLMDILTDLLDDPDGAQVLSRCRELLAQLDQHNSKEEPISTRTPRATSPRRPPPNWPSSYGPAPGRRVGSAKPPDSRVVPGQKGRRRVPRARMSSASTSRTATVRSATHHLTLKPVVKT